MADTKTEYIAPLTFSTKDLTEIQAEQKEAYLSNTPEQVGIHEFVSESFEKNQRYNNDLIQFAEKVNKIRSGDFFIEVIPYKDPIVDVLWIQGLNRKLIDRKTCPTPTPGHHVYHYSAKDEHISFLWALPEQTYIDFIRDNIVELASDLRESISDIQDYLDGTLLKIARAYNNEDPSYIERRILKLNNIVPQTDTVLKDNKTKD